MAERISFWWISQVEHPNVDHHGRQRICRLSHFVFAVGRSPARLARKLGRSADYWVYEVASEKTTQLTYSAIASLNMRPGRLPRSSATSRSTARPQRVDVGAIQLEARRIQPRPRLAPWRSDRTNRRLLEPANRGVRSRGYICIAPNVRGSTGYGMDFQKANYQDLGGGDLQDEVFAAKVLVATGHVDPKRIGITGRSYRGFMTLMAIGRTPTCGPPGSNFSASSTG